MLIKKKHPVKPCLMFYVRHFDSVSNPGRGTPYIGMIEMIVVFFSGCIRRYSNFRG